MHLIWFAFFLPPMIFMANTFRWARSPKVWSLCFGIALLGIGILAGVDVIGFYSDGGKWQHGLMRGIFAIVSGTDFPLVQLATGSAICWWLTRRSQQPGGSAHPVTPLTQ